MYVLFDKIISNYLSKYYHGAKAAGYLFYVVKKKRLPLYVFYARTTENVSGDIIQ